MSFEKIALNDEDVSRFLDGYTNGQAGDDIKALDGGEWSQAFAFEAESKHYVVRFSPTTEDFLKDHYANRFQTDDLPIPKLLDLGEAFGGHYAVSERAFGVMLDDLDLASMSATIPSIMKTISAIQATAVADTVGFGVWDDTGNGEFESWRSFLTSVDQDEPGSRSYGWSHILSQKPGWYREFFEAYDILQDASARTTNDRALIHNDLTNRNVLVTNNQISAVFDWGFSMYGDPLYEIAKLEFFDPLYAPISGQKWVETAIEHATIERGENNEFNDRLLACLLHIGLEAQVFYAGRADWNMYEPIAKRTLELSGLEADRITK